MKAQKWLTAVGLALSLTAATFATVGAAHPHSSLKVPVSNTSQQSLYEDQVSHFVSTHAEPQRSGSSVADQNDYWNSEVAYWKSAPWEAVAGQWGCSFQSVKISYNKPDSSGVRSAGYGTVTNCGNAGDVVDAQASIIETRTSVLLQDPSLDSRYQDQ